MIYKQKYYYICKTPLSAEGPEDVEVVDRADNSNEFPELFKKFEDLRSHAFNDAVYAHLLSPLMIRRAPLSIFLLWVAFMRSNHKLPRSGPVSLLVFRFR